MNMLTKVCFERLLLSCSALGRVQDDELATFKGDGQLELAGADGRGLGLQGGRQEGA